VLFRSNTTTLSLLNVSGLTDNLYSGSTIIPSITTGVAVNNYSGSGTITDLQCVDGEGSTSYFREEGGNALVLIGNYFSGGTTGQALVFTYTGSSYSSSASGRSITGISGLSSWSQSDTQHYVLDDFGYPTKDITSAFSGTELNIGSNDYIQKYSRILFIRLGVTATTYVYEYSSYSDGILNFLTPITLPVGNYVLIPLDNISSIGANGVISISNMADLGITRQRTIFDVNAKKLIAVDKTRNDLTGTIQAVAGRHSIPLSLVNETYDLNLAQPVVSSSVFINNGTSAPTNTWRPGEFSIQHLQSPITNPNITLPDLDAAVFFRLGDFDVEGSTFRNRYIIPCGPVVYFSSEPMYEDGPRIKYDDVTGYSFYSTSTTEAKLANVSVYGLTTVRGLNMTPTSIVPTSGGSTSLTTAANTILFRHSSTIASYTLTLPSGSAANHGMTITLGTRSAITSLTVNAAAADNGVTPVIYGNITTLPVGGFATFTFWYSTTPQWIRTG
jgi:hypothetical protein